MLCATCYTVQLLILIYWNKKYSLYSKKSQTSTLWISLYISLSFNKFLRYKTKLLCTKAKVVIRWPDGWYKKNVLNKRKPLSMCCVILVNVKFMCNKKKIWRPVRMQRTNMPIWRPVDIKKMSTYVSLYK